jgi:hypothetical protein
MVAVSAEPLDNENETIDAGNDALDDPPQQRIIEAIDQEVHYMYKIGTADHAQKKIAAFKHVCLVAAAQKQVTIKFRGKNRLVKGFSLLKKIWKADIYKAMKTLKARPSDADFGADGNIDISDFGEDDEVEMDAPENAYIERLASMRTSVESLTQFLSANDIGTAPTVCQMNTHTAQNATAMSLVQVMTANAGQLPAGVVPYEYLVQHAHANVAEAFPDGLSAALALITDIYNDDLGHILIAIDPDGAVKKSGMTTDRLNLHKFSVFFHIMGMSGNQSFMVKSGDGTAASITVQPFLQQLGITMSYDVRDMLDLSKKDGEDVKWCKDVFIQLCKEHGFEGAAVIAAGHLKSRFDHTLTHDANKYQALRSNLSKKLATTKAKDMKKVLVLFSSLQR